MRKGWTDHVAETRRKGNRGKKTMTHREAMQAASGTWPKIKAKLLRKQKKCPKKTPPESGAKPPAQKNEDSSA